MLKMSQFGIFMNLLYFHQECIKMTNRKWKSIELLIKCFKIVVIGIWFGWIIRWSWNGTIQWVRVSSAICPYSHSHQINQSSSDKTVKDVWMGWWTPWDMFEFLEMLDFVVCFCLYQVFDSCLFPANIHFCCCTEDKNNEFRQLNTLCVDLAQICWVLFSTIEWMSLLILSEWRENVLCLVCTF